MKHIWIRGRTLIESWGGQSGQKHMRELGTVPYSPEYFESGSLEHPKPITVHIKGRTFVISYYHSGHPYGATEIIA